MTWQPVGLEARLDGLLAKPIAVLGDGPDGSATLVLAEVVRCHGGKATLFTFDTATRTPMPQVKSIDLSPEVSLRAAVLAQADLQATQAAELPRIRWRRVKDRRLGLITPAFAIILATGGLLLQQPALIIAAVGLAASWVYADRTAVSRAPKALEGGQALRPSIIRARFPESLPPGPTLAQRGELVKEHYGQLLGDVLYRIENSALFDTAVPTTQRFQTALLLWSPTSANAERATVELEASFRLAKNHAEQLGLAHLPESARDQAHRATQLAQRALADATSPEALSARSQLSKLIQSLALYYLPVIDPTAPSLLGAPRELPRSR